MSLLLDALKKAADDKNKNKAEPAEPLTNDSGLEILETSDSPDPEDESLELELDSSIDSDNNTKDNQDEFPQVDESALQKSEQVKNEPESLKNADSNSSDEASDAPLEILDESVNETDQSSDINDSNNQSPPDEALDTDREKTKDQNDHETAPIQDLETSESATTAPDNDLVNKVESEQALSALINKSNMHSRHEKLKQNITIGILITLILIGSGLYFYIEMITSSQNLYISQNNNAAIQREQLATQTRPQAVIKNPEVSQAAATQTLKTARIPSEKPVVKSPKSEISQPKPARQTNTQPINIVRTKKPDPVHELLREAYNAFHREDYQKSESLYKKVIHRESKNRDALLGLSAIALKQQRYEYARQKYQYLLKLNPRDSIAIAGISSIENLVDPQLNESQLKFMLKNQPDAAHLYFALGALYSSQNKWPEAQSAYFSAWSAENKNADYSYNLAVSLDHLDKKTQALDFYKLSLKLNKVSKGNFSVEHTQNRIQTLENHSK